MGNRGRHLNRGDCKKPTAFALLDAPLEFIHEDHLRERQICTLIDQIAESDAPDRTSVARILTFLSNELPLHLKDEEEDLFPLLQRRCEPDDDIERVIVKLHADHAHAGDETPKVVSILEETIRTSRVSTNRERTILRAFTSHSRRHLILENAIILPFSRLRLTDYDLETLQLRMRQRREGPCTKEATGED